MPEEQSTSGSEVVVSVAIVYDSGSRGHPLLGGRTRGGGGRGEGGRGGRGHGRQANPRRATRELLGGARRGRRHRLRLPDLHGFGLGGAQGIHGGDLAAALSGAAVEGQARRGVHELGGYER